MPLADAEFGLLRFMGIEVYRSRRLDGKNPRWCPELSMLVIPSDFTDAEAEDVSREVLALLVHPGS